MPDYIPGPVPLDQEQVAVYLQGELHRIANVLNGAVARAYGGMIQTILSVDVPLTPAFVPFDVWDTEIPIEGEPHGIISDPVTGILTITTGGVFAVYFSSVNEVVGNNEAFEFVAAINGVQTPARAAVDPSNQTDRVTVDINGILAASRGDQITIEAASSSGDNWVSSSSEFFAFRISGSRD